MSLEQIAVALGSGPGASSEQAIGFLRHRGVHVAYALSGDGPPLLLDLGHLHHLEVFWKHAPYRLLVQRLARHSTVVRWDRPGFGLSDRGPPDLSPAAGEALTERLVEHLGAGPVTILAAGDAGPGAVRFAARHPERVSRLALFGTAAAGNLVAPSLPDAALSVLAGGDEPAIHDLVAAAQTAGCEPEVFFWLASALEASADAPTLACAAALAVDARPHAGAVRAPTLVVHRARDRVLEPSLGRALATAIPGASFVEVPGEAHPLFAGDPAPVLSALEPFLASGDSDRHIPLTQRELEVARLVTLGLTNAEIGHRLAIQRRTVDAHLEHIRAKLGVSSRARIASWAVRNHPEEVAAGGA